MFRVIKRMEIAGAHNLRLDYESKCSQIHGHNWIVTVHCESEVLNANGMIMDFTHIKKAISDRLDHHYINDVVAPLNPTAENMAKWICDEVNKLCVVGRCYRVDVQESEGNIASYEV